MEFWKKFFKYAAFWNWAFAANGLIFPNLTLKIMGLSQSPGVGLFQAEFFGAVALFGLMYWWIHEDPASETAKKLVQLGIIGKMLVFISFAIYYFSGKISIFGFLPTVGDFVFSIFFFAFLLFFRETPSQTTHR